MPKSGVPRKSPDWCAWTFLYLSRSVGGARGVRFLPGPTSFTLQRCKYERKLFAKSFWNLGNYFLNPRNYFLIWVPKLETTDKPRFAFTNPSTGQEWQSITWNPEIAPDKWAMLSPRERERERGCQAVGAGILPSLYFHVLCLLISESATVSFFSICKEFP